MALLGRDTGALTTYTDALSAEPALAALRDRMSVATDPALKDTEAQVIVRLASGAELRAHHDLDWPIPAAAREAKIRAKASALLGANKADATLGGDRGHRPPARRGACALAERLTISCRQSRRRP